MFLEIVVLKKFPNFTGKQVAGLQKCNFLKKKLQHRFFPVKFAKFLRTPCFTEHLQWVLLKVLGFQPATLLKKRLRQRCLSVSFAKFLRTSFLLAEHLRMTASCIYLWILRSFSKHLFYRAPRGNCYLMYKLSNFNHQIQLKTILQVLFKHFIQNEK